MAENDRDQSARSVGPALLVRFWFLWVAIALWIAVPLDELATRVWTTEQGTIGPLILISGLWLLWVENQGRSFEEGNMLTAMVALVMAAILYVLGSLLDFLTASVIALDLGLVTLFYLYYGAAALRRSWFPLIYLLFVLPMPFALTAPLTLELKLWIAQAAVNIVSLFGIEAAAQGASLYVDQYELAVEGACAGLNSLASLMALGAFYLYLRRSGGWRYTALLAMAIVPIAILTNLLRVALLLWLVHLFGVGILDTPMHVSAGLTMALVAMAVIASLDHARPLATAAYARISR